MQSICLKPSCHPLRPPLSSTSRNHKSLLGFPNRSCYPKLRTNYKHHRICRTIPQISTTGSLDPPANHISESHAGPIIRGACFYLVTALSAIFLFAVMVVSHPFVLLLDRYRRRGHHLLAKVWAVATIAMFYKVEIEGMENLPPLDVPAVYVSNHQSFLDIYTLLTLGRSFRFISKRSIFLFPIIGWAMYMMGSVPIRRMDSKSQLECLKHCIKLVKKGTSIFFFPEGTRSKDGKLGAFKKGAFSVAAKTNAPVVPISLMGTGKIMPPGKENIVNSGLVRVVIHKPIEGKGTQQLCNEARRVIADTLVLHGYDVHHYD